VIHARRGVALIIAISVLAALLFLALPFVFSQGASLSGARAAAWDGAARRGTDRASGLGTAMSVFATGLHRAPSLVAALQTYVQLPLQITDGNGAIRYPGFVDNSWRLVLESTQPWSHAGLPSLDDHDAGTGAVRDAVHGTVIEDESRRLDPNVLGERGWAIVLDRAGITDPATVSWSWGNGDPAKPANDPLRYGRWVGLSYGRLANRLADFRPANSHRYNRLEDLLGADPNETVSDPPPPWTLGCEPTYPQGHDRHSGAPVWPLALGSSWTQARNNIDATRNAQGENTTPSDPAIDGYRVAPLTQAELERLRPFLSFLIPGQGRSGVIDVGSVVLAAPQQGDWEGVTTDELSPHQTGVGMPMRPHNSARIRSQSSPGGRYLTNSWANQRGDALAIDAPPAMNINTVPADSDMVRLFSADAAAAGWPTDPVDTPVTSIGKLGRLAWLDGRLGDQPWWTDGSGNPVNWDRSASSQTTTFERPGVGILGYGIVAIEGAATALDRQGGATAQRRRRTVVQAVPQERPLEAAWRTQGELEALIRARHGAWIQAGPHPTNRIKDWGADAGDMPALDCAGWLEPAPLVSFGRSAAAQFDWLVPFGVTRPQEWDSVLVPVDADGNPDSAHTPIESPTLKPSGMVVGALTAQGLHLQGGSTLAYRVSDSAGPLRFAGSGTQEMSSRHVSLRFCLPTTPGNVTTLAELRSQQDLVLGPAVNEHTNLWRVEYRENGGDGMLVLIIANAALPWTKDDRSAALGGKDWQTDSDTPGADEDLRCGPGAHPFAPPDPATRVEFRYAVPGGLTVGQWYHLQVFCASDQPGQHGLTLDGLVGRDATRSGVDMKQLGDHYTWPSLRVTDTVGASSPKTDGGAALLTTPTLSVTFPADLTLAYDPAGSVAPEKCILPKRGILRIDDEYFSYTDATGSNGSGTITGVQRARRVNTNQEATITGVISPGPPPVPGPVPDPDLRWPVTQAHVAGALATPGWSQVGTLSGYWLRGDGILQQDFQPITVTGTAKLTEIGTIAGTYRFPATGSLITITPTPGVTWPDRGLVRFTWAGGSAVAAIKGPGPDFTIEWGAAPLTTTRPDDVPDDEIATTVISLEINGPLADTATARYWYDGGLAQLFDQDNGRCEWIRIDSRNDRDAITGALVTGKYLLRMDGWDMTDYTLPNPPRPILQPRGAMRTVRRTTVWPKTTTRVLPVQTRFDLDRLESGDVLTLVPDTVVYGTNEPTRLLVRHAARDAFPAVADSTVSEGPRYDTKNECFALAHGVPTTLADPNPPGGGPAVPQTALIGRGWSGDDLSMVGNAPSRRGALPRLVLVGGANAKISLGSGTSQDVILDDLCAGPQTGAIGANGTSGLGIVKIGGVYGGTIAATKDALPVEVEANQDVFQQINGLTYGLCAIDGEVFAYRRIGDRNALLIARALLGSAMAVHALPPEPPTQVVDNPGQTTPTVVPRTYREVRPMLPVVRLPLGPIGELCTDLAKEDHGKALDVVDTPFSTYYRDPAWVSPVSGSAGFQNHYQDIYGATGQRLPGAAFVMIHDPAGDPSKPSEVLRLLDHPSQANQRITADWLRGLYGTTAQDWTAGFPDPATRPLKWQDQDPPATPFVPLLKVQGSGKLNPIVMAWWPRFAPGLPAGVAVADLGPALRSRSFAWAGFPFRLHGMRMDSTIQVLTTSGLGSIPVATEADCDLQARAQAAGDGADELFDWDKSPALALSPGANPITGSPFSGWPGSRFTGREVDGAELRVHWPPSVGSLTGLAAAVDAQGRAPRLGATDAEAGNAPAVTAGIRMRCVAPTRVLAVEEVR
jgi:hypothetical protein